jgi:hypothetical protein
MQSFTQHVTLSEARGPDLKRLSAPSAAEPALSTAEGHPQGDN